MIRDAVTREALHSRGGSGRPAQDLLLYRPHVLWRIVEVERDSPTFQT
jgi:hypothetical protein